MKRRPLMVVTALAIVVVIIVWYLALWSPRQSAIKKAKADTASALADVSTLQAQLSALQAQAHGQTQREIELTRLRAAIPQMPDISSVVISLYNAASDAGIDLTNFTDSPPATGTPPSVRIGLTVDGNFYQILQFMNDLAALPRLVVIDNVSLNPGGGAAKSTAQVGVSPSLTVQLAGRIFVTTATAVSSALTTTTSTPKTTKTTATSTPTTTKATTPGTTSTTKPSTTRTTTSTARPQ